MGAIISSDRAFSVLLPRAKARLSRRVSWRKSLGVKSGIYLKISERSEIVKLKSLVTRFKVKSLYDIGYLYG
jgi:hypothetical protein